MVSEDMVLPVNEVTDLKRYAMFAPSDLKLRVLYILRKLFSHAYVYLKRIVRQK